ncbi:hypothetical protein FB451DRAFT_308211 [Mycena latifolia]|nr:hypothetical protein FB451DRAFT_308211 [Mycena latifolia]
MLEVPLEKSALLDLMHSNIPPDNAQMQIARAVLSQTELEIGKLEAEIHELSLRGASDQVALLAKEKGAAEESAFRLQSILSPWRRLPPELLAEIFLFSWCDDWDYPPLTEYAPLLLLRVCHAWRALALATPALWSKLSWYITRNEDIDIVDTWISRCGGCPLYLDIHLPLVGEDGDPPALFWDIERLFQKHLHRFETLDIRTSPILLPLLLNGASRLHTLYLDTYSWNDARPNLDFHSLPSLRRLYYSYPHVKNFNVPWHQLTTLSLHDQAIAHVVLHILVQCHALVDCTVGFSRNDPISVDWSNVTPTTLHALEEFSVRGPSDAMTLVLSSLTLPALRRLELWADAQLLDAIGNFLERSSCPLKSMFLLGMRDSPAPADIIKCLRPVTETLSSLNLAITLCDLDELLLALTDDGSGDFLCPHMESISFPDLAWWTGGRMADMVESRWRDGAVSQLKHLSCRILIEQCFPDLPRLENLQRRGLDIWIPKTHPFPLPAWYVAARSENTIELGAEQSEQ